MSPKEVYDILKNDNSIINIYNKIEESEETKFYAYHNYSHVMNVMNVAEKILKDLNESEDLIYQVKIASLLHDVGAITGKDGHAERSYLYAKKLFSDNNWNFDGMEDVLDAIRYHSASFDKDSIVTLSLIFADKLDIKKTRITPFGKQITGNREYSHIEDIDISINNNYLYVNFITDGNLNYDEFVGYYFTIKVFKAIIAFANKINLGYKVTMDNIEMDIGVYEQSRNI